MDRVRPGSDRGSSQGGPELPKYMQKPVQSRVVYSSASGAAPTAKRAGGASGGAAGRSGAQQGRTGSSQGGGAKRKPKATRAQRLMRLALCVFGVLVLVVCGILLLTSSGSESGPPQTLATYDKQGDTFREGVSVAGVQVGGMTVSEAKTKVEQAVANLMGEVSITLQHTDDSWTFTAADMQMQADTNDVLVNAMAYKGAIDKDAAGAMANNAGAFPVKLSVNRSAVINRLNMIASEANVAPVEPHAIPTLNLDPIEAKFEPVEGRNGLVLNEEATADLIIASVEAGGLQDRLTPVFDTIAPTMTLDFIMENTKKISSFSTKYKNHSSDETVQNRCFNIQKTADIINCYVAQPSEIFSFNGYVGPRNKENGWKQANGISKGKEYTLQYGGGICQVSTTLYGALLRGNVKIPEGGRRKHTIPSTYVKKGLDATVDTSGIDFMFENDTGAPLYVFAYTVKKGTRDYEMVVSLYGKPLPSGVRYEPVSEVSETIPAKEPKYTDDPTIPLGYQKEIIVARDGYVADVYLEKYEGDKLVSRNKLYTDTYGGNAGEYLRGTGDRATVKVPAGATLMPGYDPIDAPGAAQQPDEEPGGAVESDSQTQ